MYVILIFFWGFFFRIYFGESNNFSENNDLNLKSCNPKLLEYEKSKNRMIVFVSDVFLDDPKVSETSIFYNVQ